jgi:deoxyribonuclease V
MHPSKKRLEYLNQEQIRLSKKIKTQDLPGPVEKAAGIDVSYKSNIACAVAVIIDGDLNLLKKNTVRTPVDFPYISGYLAYREIKSSIAALENLGNFDVLFVNGHGLAHPRGFGLASHLGLILEKPTIGVARRLMIGKPKNERISSTPIVFKNKIIGFKIPTPSESSIYVSIGNLVTLNDAIRITKKFFLKGRLPEPLRIAHKLANICRQSIEA